MFIALVFQNNFHKKRCECTSLLDAARVFKLAELCFVHNARPTALPECLARISKNATLKVS